MKKKTSRIRKFILPVIIALALVAGAAWKLGKNKEKMAGNAAIANQKITVFPVTVANPLVADISQDFEVMGTFNASHELTLASEVSGRVTSVSARNGDHVSKGQVLARIDNEQVSIDLALATTNLEKLRNDLEKYETMLQGNAVNRQQVEEARLNVKNAESKVATLQRQLRISSITAPISGNINSFSIEVGSYLSPGAKMAELVDVSTLKMTVQLLDNEVVRVREGQKIKLVPDLYPAAEFTGEIVSIASKADRARRFNVEIEVKNSNLFPLKAGMTGKALFEAEGSKKAMTIPVKAIVGSTQDPKVFVVSGNTAKIRAIRIGSVLDGKAEVLNGLDSTDRVVISGQLNIVDGSKIQVIQ